MNNNNPPLPGKEPATIPETHERIFNGRSYSITVYETCAFVYWQSVNAKTGKGWQQHRDTTRFEGDKFINKAYRAWLYAGR